MIVMLNYVFGLSFFPSLFNIQFEGFPDATVYGTTSGFPYGFHGNHTHRFPPATARGQQSDNVLNFFYYY